MVSFFFGFCLGAWGLVVMRFSFGYGIPGLGNFIGNYYCAFLLSCIIIKYCFVVVGGIIVIFFIEPPLKISFVFVLVEKAFIFPIL
jgi:hypothetical protein